MFNGASYTNGRFEHPLNEYKGAVDSRIVLDFFLHCALNIAAEHADGMGSSSIGAGGHGGNVSALQNEEARGS